MALATSSDVVAALGRSLTSAESAVVSNLLDQASDLVTGYLGRWPDPVPGPVARVVAAVVKAVLEKPSITVANYDATGYSTSREYAQVAVGVESATSSGPWLTKSQKMALNPFRLGVRSVGMVSEAGE
jgi:hypothetical protein